MPPPSGPSRTPKQLRLKLRRRAAAGRADFVISPTNAEAIAALDAWPAWHGGCLALVGPEGGGKSHLARDWAHRTGAVVIEGELPAFSHLDGGLVLLEDADRLASHEMLFHLINRAGAPGAGLLLTARTAPQSWPTAVPDLRSRLNALPVAEIRPPDDIVLEGVLRKFFRERSIRPADDVYPYLLRRIERSVPAALDIVARLDEAADAEQREITRLLARQILENEGETLNLFE
jgi:chromosomal replication initiation ATPase DnaA